MAFATSNVYRQNQGSVNVATGTWTATIGDAAGTITFGTPVLSAQFWPNQTSGAVDENVAVSGLNSTTLTVYHQTTVTDGRFEVKFRG